MSTPTRIACRLASVAGIAALSCGDPEPTAPQAALSITIGGGVQGQQCPWPNTGTNLPELPSGQGQNLVGASSASERPERLFIDGCRVAPDGAGAFIVSGQINTGDVVFNLNTRAGISTAGGQVDITFQGPNLSQTGVKNPAASPCSARALEFKPEGGAIFIEFSCPLLTDEFTVNSACATTGARVILENCKTALQGS